jgi:23S rRNA (uracil1939-C5)-methyltransferase
MLVWMTMALMTGAAALAVLWPLARPQRTGDSAPDGPDAAFYRAQLTEIERDAARGLKKGSAVRGIVRLQKVQGQQLAGRAALRAGFARVSIEGADVLTERPPSVQAGTATIYPPPGSFLQASAEAEAEMERIVREHLKFASRVADLFSGCGTFALRLAAESSVLAAEGNAAAIEALYS